MEDKCASCVTQLCHCKYGWLVQTVAIRYLQAQTFMLLHERWRPPCLIDIPQESVADTQSFHLVALHMGYWNACLCCKVCLADQACLWAAFLDFASGQNCTWSIICILLWNNSVKTLAPLYKQNSACFLFLHLLAPSQLWKQLKDAALQLSSSVYFLKGPLYQGCYIRGRVRHAVNNST